MATSIRSQSVIEEITSLIGQLDDVLGKFGDRAEEFARRDKAGLISAEDYAAMGVDPVLFGEALTVFGEIYGTMDETQKASFQLARK